MAEFTISEVLEATGAKLAYQVKERVFTGVSTDTRKINPGELFVALAGNNYDGHDFTEKACLNGAAGVIACTDNVKTGADTAVFVAKNGTLDALQKLAKFHRMRFNIPVVGITGSNGKTTTKEMVASILATRLKVLKTESNYNNEIGLPLTILKITPEHEAVVVEMAMRAKGEIRKLAEIARPTVAVVTNVSQTHIELLGSIDNIAQAKAELVEALDVNGLAILNGDNKYVKEMEKATKAKTIFYGLSSRQFVQAESIFSDAENIQTAFICHSARGSLSVIIPTIGVHNVFNALAAIAAGWELGLKPLEIQAGLLEFKPVDMRQTIIRKDHYTLINDAYNASPTSMAAAINTLDEVAKGRKIAVLGDMLELGTEAAAAHETVGELLAQKGVDALITIGELSSFTAAKARAEGVPFVVECVSHYNAKQELEKFIEPGDTVLFKGSRSMEMERVLELLEI